MGLHRLWMLSAVLAVAVLGAGHPTSVAGPASAGDAPIAVTLFTHTVAWRTAPRSLVTADLRRDGRLQSQAEARATDGGDVTLYVSDFRLDREGRDAALRPGDLLALRASGAGGSSAVTVTMPTLLVEAHPDVDRIAGQAEPGAAVAPSAPRRLGAAGSSGLDRADPRQRTRRPPRVDLRRRRPPALRAVRRLGPRRLVARGRAARARRAADVAHTTTALGAPDGGGVGGACPAASAGLPAPPRA